MSNPTLLEIQEHDTELEIHTDSRDALSLWGQQVIGPAGSDGLVLESLGGALQWIQHDYLDATGDTMTGDLVMDGADIIPGATAGDLGKTDNRFANVFADAIDGTTITGTLATASQPNVTTMATLALPWAQVTGTPITLAGYGITDAAPLSHVSDTANPHSVTKAQVGLGNVENTALSTWAGSAQLTTLGAIASGAVPASLVTVGTFGAGAYVFPDNLTVSGTLFVGAAEDNASLVRAGANLLRAEGDFGVAGALSATDLAASGNLTVSGIGPHQIGGVIVGRVGLDVLSGGFTSDGSGTFAAMFRAGGSLTGAAGDTGFLVGGLFACSFTTQGNADTISDVVQVRIDEPHITVGAGDTITNATTLKIVGAPTEGVNNRALWVASGTTSLDGGLTVTDTTTLYGATVPGTAATYDLGSATNEWRDVYMAGVVRFGSAQDTTLFRGAADRLDLGAGDSLYLSGVGSVAVSGTGGIGIGIVTPAVPLDVRLTGDTSQRAAYFINTSMGTDGRTISLVLGKDNGTNLSFELEYIHSTVTASRSLGIRPFATTSYVARFYQDLTSMFGGKVLASGGLGVGNSAAATTPGSVVKKVELFDAAGASLGFVPIYDAIT